MHKIASDGATVDNQFTEGNVALNIPATIVSAAWLNAVQGELVNLIERYGIELNEDDSDDATQAYKAIEKMFMLGGRPSRILQNLANNQAAPADIAGFPQFDSSSIQTVEFLFTIVRKTDTGLKKETGRCYLSYDETNGWEISRISGFDGGGVTFVMTLVSGTNFKLQYKTDNLAGSSYDGKLRITDIKTVLV